MGAARVREKCVLCVLCVLRERGWARRECVREKCVLCVLCVLCVSEIEA